MSNWKPEGWNESRDVMAKECADDEKFKNSDLETLIRAMFDAGAEAMLGKVCLIIEGMGNPWQSEYMVAELYNPSADRAIEGCRKLILSLLGQEV